MLSSASPKCITQCHVRILSSYIFIVTDFRLHQYIRGQEYAMEIIKGEFSHWEFLREAGIYRPLVMTFSGPSGEEIGLH